ncbi:hypothetical protein [Gymnodinialimonas ulvae]|uniref:hypothetical protein n=1 Tax=Gymnodinialimonas ulvae TaxID=3126504 RepID=UPI0030987D8C
MFGFPYDNGGTWDGVDGAVFMGANGGAGTFTVIAIIICVVALVIGQLAENGKYKKHSARV